MGENILQKTLQKIMQGIARVLQAKPTNFFGKVRDCFGNRRQVHDCFENRRCCTSSLRPLLQAFGIMAAFVLLLIVILALSMTFGPPRPSIPNAICNLVGNTTFCHF